MEEKSGKIIDVKEVRHMAMLSRLIINEEEEKIFAEQFSAILNHMAVLNNVDTENVEPLYSPASQPEATRPDIARNLRTAEQILANAPQTDGEYFIVPRII